jgi:hypothetical protein
MRPTPTMRLVPFDLSIYPSHIYLKRLVPDLLEGSKTKIQGFSEIELIMEARQEVNIHIVLTGTLEICSQRSGLSG